MELIKLSIPASFIAQAAQVTWREILFGIENELLDPSAAVDFAIDQIEVQAHPSLPLVELATLGTGNPRELVQRLAEMEPQQAPEAIQRKWLYFSLGWIFEHRVDYADPLQTVEEVYADFGYPESMASFVRYMPTSEPDLGIRAVNERRMYDNWQRYLRDAGAEYASPPPAT